MARLCVGGGTGHCRQRQIKGFWRSEHNKVAVGQKFVTHSGAGGQSASTSSESFFKKCRTSGRILDLWDQNLQFDKIPSVEGKVVSDLHPNSALTRHWLWQKHTLG